MRVSRRRQAVGSTRWFAVLLRLPEGQLHHSLGRNPRTKGLSKTRPHPVGVLHLLAFFPGMLLPFREHFFFGCSINPAMLAGL